MLELIVTMIVNVCVFWSLFPNLEDGCDHNYRSLMIPS